MPGSAEQYVCSFVPAWREVQASTYAARVKELDVNGMYLDPFGFAGQPRDCWSREHGHPVPGYAVIGERDCTKTVHTLYNSRHRTARGDMLRVKREPNIRYFDAWNERSLEPRQDGDVDILSLEIGPRDVGCVVCTQE